MISDTLFSVFLTVFMLYRLLEMAVSIVKLILDNYVNFRLVKTWFPLRGTHNFFLSYVAPGTVMVSMGLELLNLSCMSICNFCPYFFFVC